MKSGKTTQRSSSTLPSSDFNLRPRNTTAERSKYGNRKTPLTFDGQTWLFDSKREAGAALGLLIRQRAGEVRDLYFQVRFPLDVNGYHVCFYVADFVYEERVRRPLWVRIVADAKGYRTDVYRLKKKLMKAIHGIDVVEL